MFTAVTFEDANGAQVSLFDATRRLGEVVGLHGIPAPRVIARPRPGGHGEINETKHYLGRRPVWNGTLTAANDDALWAAYDEILGALWGAVSETRTLRWTRGDGIALQSMVRLLDAFEPAIRATDAGRILAYQLTFHREDPRNYSQTLRAAVGAALSTGGGGWTFPATLPVIFAPAGGGDTVVLNSGTIETPATLTIHGLVDNPQILQVNTGRLIVLSGTISAGSTLVVDGTEKTVLLDGVTDRADLVDFAATNWDTALVPPGGCTYRLLATNWDANARMDSESRDAYA